VYIGSDDHRLYALDLRTGRVRWSAPTDGWIWGRPAVAGDRVYVQSNRSAGGHLYAFDAATGALVWTSPETLSGVGGPVVAGDLVVAAGLTATSAYDRATGVRRWTRATGGDAFLAPTASFVTPRLDGDSVLVSESQASGASRIVALDVATGTPRSGVSSAAWGPTFSRPLIRGGRLLLGDDNGAVHAFALGATGPATVHRAVTRRRAPRARHRDVLGDMLDPDAMTELGARGEGVPAVSSSLDVRGLNNDYNHFHGFDADGRHVMMDVHGAGVVTNLFMGGIGISGTSVLAPAVPPPNDPAYLSSSRVTVTVDNQAKPIIDTSVGQFFAGGAGFPFLFPLVAENSAGQTSHVPIPYRRHIKIVLTQAPGDALFWYDVFYTRFPDARGVRSFDATRDHDRYQALIDRWTASGRNPRPARPSDVTRHGTVTIAPGERAVLLDARDAGEITELRLDHFIAQKPSVTLPDSHDQRSRDAEPFKRTFVQARWDDQPRRSVDAPVDAFFGSGFGQARNFDSLIFGEHGLLPSELPSSYEHPSEPDEATTPLGERTYTYFPMPFARHAQLALVNRLPAGATPVDVAYTVRYRRQPIRRTRAGLFRGRTPIGYFSAHEFHNAKDAGDSPFPDRGGNDQLVNLPRPGSFVGMVLNGTTHNFGSGNVDPVWQEGDCMFWVDGAADLVPTFTSTGHEECFDGGFYYENVQNTPTSGVTKRDLAGNVALGPGNYSDEISTFHLFTGDAIRFRHRLQGTIEHGANNGFAGVDESGVWFAYLKPPRKRGA
jgi:hypothetical protein